MQPSDDHTYSHSSACDWASRFTQFGVEQQSTASSLFSVRIQLRDNRLTSRNNLLHTCNRPAHTFVTYVWATRIPSESRAGRAIGADRRTKEGDVLCANVSDLLGQEAIEAFV
eukprot:COSAG02_NODE_6889_length_3306_cov_3.096040_4_plen_112_part_01